jgi:hypothetical protein
MNYPLLLSMCLVSVPCFLIPILHTLGFPICDQLKYKYLFSCNEFLTATTNLPCHYQKKVTVVAAYICLFSNTSHCHMPYVTLL